MSLASVTYGLSITTIVLFGVVALFLARRRQRVKKDDTEFFLTARNSVPLRTIAWSFYAQGVGAWYVIGTSFEIRSLLSHFLSTHRDRYASQ